MKEYKNVGRVIISDISKDTVLRITTDKKDNNVIKLTFTGDINDTCLIQDEFKIPGGMVKTKIDFDFYTSTFNLKYKSFKAKSGTLVIDYYIP
jgi:hypothetical protein